MQNNIIFCYVNLHTIDVYCLQKRSMEVSERYGACKLCNGQGRLNRNDCGRCDGTGFSGDSIDYIDTRYALAASRGKRLTYNEEAIEHAVRAIRSAQNRFSKPGNGTIHE